MKKLLIPGAGTAGTIVVNKLRKKLSVKELISYNLMLSN
jgi:hypothetical protein